MPNITFDGPKLSRKDKRELAEKFTAAAVEATGFPAPDFVVVFKENDPENVAIGGVLVADRMETR